MKMNYTLFSKNRTFFIEETNTLQLPDSIAATLKAINDPVKPIKDIIPIIVTIGYETKLFLSNLFVEGEKTNKNKTQEQAANLVRYQIKSLFHTFT